MMAFVTLIWTEKELPGERFPQVMLADWQASLHTLTMGRPGTSGAKTVRGRELVAIARLRSKRRIAENLALRWFNWTPLQEELFQGALKSLCGFYRCKKPLAIQRNLIVGVGIDRFH